MRRLSLNARLSPDATASSEIEVVLIEFTHPDLEAPIRLSTDNADVIDRSQSLYGTRSTWRGADPVTDPYLWIVASAIVPGDDEDAPASAQIVLENLDARMVDILRSFTDMATVNIAVVMAASPNVIEGEWLNLQLTSAEGDDGEIVIQFDREEIEQELFPSGRMTRWRFPGLHL